MVEVMGRAGLDVEVARGALCGSFNRGLEATAVDSARATGLKQHAPGFDETEGEVGEAGVGPECARDCAGAGCERRGIDDDDVVAFLSGGQRLHHLECIPGRGPVLDRCVARHMPPCGLR